jgi:prolyl-tRNA synthetase
MESKRGFIRAPWCGDEKCEDKIKEETMATIRVIPLGESEGRAAGCCVRCGRAGKAVAYFARAY